MAAFDRSKIYPGDPAWDFCVELSDVCETKFRANLGGDAYEWWGEWYNKYVAAGRPKQIRKWLLEQLKNEFLSMGDPPKWLNMDNAHWPFHKNRPMVFLTQIALTSRPETKELIPGRNVAYLFGISDTDEKDCLIMVYKGVTIHR